MQLYLFAFDTVLMATNFVQLFFDKEKQFSF